MNKKQIVLDFIKKHKLAVISTVDQNSNPEAAVLEFGQTDNLEIIFDTLPTSRKYKNLQTNIQVAFVIGWDEHITVQYEGIAKELKGEELEKCKKIYFEKNPEAKRWEDKVVYFRVTPVWIRYSDLNKNPWDVFEIEFEEVR